MKSVLISIQPKYCKLIASGKKTIEVWKTRPKIETPFKCYIYATKSDRYLLDREPDGELFCWDKKSHHYPFKYEENFEELFSRKVIGEFVCDRIDDFSQWENDYPSLLRHIDLYAGTNGDYKFLDDYLKGEKQCYGWHISDLKIYDKPKELNEFHKPCSDKYRYCQGCKHGFDFIPSDEEEYAFYHGGQYDSFETVCTNFITRPPMSWCYVEEL